MSFDNFLFWNASNMFQSIYVLRVDSTKNAFLVEKGKKSMCIGWRQLFWKKLADKMIEWSWVLFKISSSQTARNRFLTKIFRIKVKAMPSKIASGKGKLYFLSLKYKPVDGDRKSGIPAEVEIPAPHIITTFSIFSFLMDLITSSRRYFSSFCSREMNWPIFS